MAITVTPVQLDSTIHLATCGRFEVQVTGGGGTTTERGWYQLSIDGVSVGSKSYLGVGTHALRFNQQLANYLLTPHPGLVSSATSIPDAVKDWTFSYGTYISDEANCDSNSESGGSSAGAYTAVNAVLQNFDDFDFTDAFFMTRRPTSYRVCGDTSDAVTVWGGLTGATVGISSGGAPSPVVVPAGTVMYVPLGIDNYPAGSKVDVSIDSGKGFVTAFSVFVEDCCCTGSTEEIHFLENIGGWSVLQFDCSEDGGSAIRSHSSVCLADYCTVNSMGRTRLINEGSAYRKKLSGSFDINRNDLPYFTEFFTSRKHLIKQQMPNGDYKLLPCVIPNNTFQFDQQSGRLEVECEVELEYNVL